MKLGSLGRHGCAPLLAEGLREALGALRHRRRDRTAPSTSAWLYFSIVMKCSKFTVLTHATKASEL